MPTVLRWAASVNPSDQLWPISFSMQPASVLAIAPAVSPLVVSLARTVSQKPLQNRKHS